MAGVALSTGKGVLNHDRCFKSGDIGPYSVCFYGKFSYLISSIHDWLGQLAGRNFAGGSLDFLSAFSIMTGLAYGADP